ncbi:hypothetical protein MRB53_033666 [Persea americana]|uniref:Uncharacterized protein n=1 Tax=Persea americana TaxID=3435 RepID=A0ACC2KV47_PERAE|nr:hypothetical protein MRB53_033666 [Persea americana]
MICTGASTAFVIGTVVTWRTLALTGCKNCANVAPDVFGIEENFGRARVCNQSGNPDLVQQAIDSWSDQTTADHLKEEPSNGVVKGH